MSITGDSWRKLRENERGTVGDDTDVEKRRMEKTDRKKLQIDRQTQTGGRQINTNFVEKVSS